MTRKRRLAALLACALLAAVQPGAARADDDEEEAQAALERGAARPLDELLGRVSASFAGSVLKVELEREDEDDVPWVYEVKLLTPEGDVLKLAYDAATLELISLKGRHREKEDDD